VVRSRKDIVPYCFKGGYEVLRNYLPDIVRFGKVISAVLYLSTINRSCALSFIHSSPSWRLCSGN
jgi:hypothetical protein